MMGDLLPPREPPKGVSFEDAWASLQESGRQLRELGQYIRNSSAKTDRKMRETDRKMQETDRELREIGQYIKTVSARTDKQLGELGNRFGELAEHLVTPNIAEKFRALGYAFTKAGPHLEFFDSAGKALTEVDVWLENGEFAMAVEVKAYLRKGDVEDHIRRMEILRRYLDERGDPRKLLGAAAGAIVRAELKRQVLEKGLYVIEQSGDTVKIEVPGGFKPRMW